MDTGSNCCIPNMASPDEMRPARDSKSLESRSCRQSLRVGVNDEWVGMESKQTEPISHENSPHSLATVLTRD